MMVQPMPALHLADMPLWLAFPEAFQYFMFTDVELLCQPVY